MCDLPRSAPSRDGRPRRPLPHDPEPAARGKQIHCAAARDRDVGSNVRRNASPAGLRAALIEERTTKQSDSDGSKQHERRISNGRNSDRRFGVGLAWVKQTGYDAFGSGLAQVRRARRERSNNIKQMIPISVESFLGSPPEQAPDLYWRRQRSETAFRAPPGDASTPGWHPRP